MQLLKTIAQMLQIGKDNFHRILNMIRTQTQLNVTEQVLQQRYQNHYVIDDNECSKFDNILKDGFKYQPNECLIKNNLDKIIDGEGWDQVDFVYLQNTLKTNNTALLRFSKVLKSKTDIKVDQLQSIKKGIIDQANKLLKQEEFHSDHSES